MILPSDVSFEGVDVIYLWQSRARSVCYQADYVAAVPAREAGAGHTEVWSLAWPGLRQHVLA